MVERDFNLYYNGESGRISFTVEIDELKIPVDICFVKSKVLKISIDSPVPVSIIFTLNLPTRTFIYEKDIHVPKFIDQVLCVGIADRKTVYGSIKIKRLSAPIWNVFDDGGSGDFIIVAEDQEIKLSKELLKAHSSVFAAMFETDCVEAKENKIIIKDFTFDVIKTVIKILYSEKVPFEAAFKTMKEVCRFVDKYDMKALWNILEEWLDNRLTFYNACQVAIVAETFFPIFQTLLTNVHIFLQPI
uniref:BTB domain-containing protein n=1 Tax=Panagrolaimus sp. JU765 TaxID=591449 RepID=A0AC34QQE2_9BILA